MITLAARYIRDNKKQVSDGCGYWFAWVCVCVCMCVCGLSLDRLTQWLMHTCASRTKWIVGPSSWFNQHFHSQLSIQNYLVHGHNSAISGVVVSKRWNILNPLGLSVPTNSSRLQHGCACSCIAFLEMFPWKFVDRIRNTLPIYCWYIQAFADCKHLKSASHPGIPTPKR